MGMMTGAFGRNLRAEYKKIAAEAFKRQPELWRKVWDVRTEDSRNFVQIGDMSFFGLMAEKPEGTDVTFRDAMERYDQTTRFPTYGLGYQISLEMIEDNLHEVKIPRMTRGLIRSAKETQEWLHSDVFNDAFAGATYTAKDSVPICSTSHLDHNNAVWANRPSTDVDLDQDSLQAALTTVTQWNDDTGAKRIQVGFNRLIIPPQLRFLAKQILRSEKVYSDANNAINPLRDENIEIIVDTRITDADSWFLMASPGDIEDGFISYQRRPLTLTDDGDFKTDNVQVKATMRCGRNVFEARSVYGSSGAA